MDASCIQVSSWIVWSTIVDHTIHCKPVLVQLVAPGASPDKPTSQTPIRIDTALMFIALFAKLKFDAKYSIVRVQTFNRGCSVRCVRSQEIIKSNFRNTFDTVDKVSKVIRFVVKRSQPAPSQSVPAFAHLMSSARQQQNCFISQDDMKGWLQPSLPKGYMYKHASKRD
jgi:hypothetical protein